MQLNEQEQKDVASAIEQIDAAIAEACKAANLKAPEVVGPIKVSLPFSSRTSDVSDATIERIRQHYLSLGWRIDAGYYGSRAGQHAVSWQFTLHRLAN